jgi:hypothetical protein
VGKLVVVEVVEVVSELAEATLTGRWRVHSDIDKEM